MRQRAAMEMKIVEHLSDEDRQILFGWGYDLFGVAAYGLSWRAKDWHALRLEYGQLVAKASILKHRLFVNQEGLWVGGVGGVITIPTAQKLGHATAIMAYTADHIRDHLRVPFGLLFCREPLVQFYARLGWHLINHSVIIRQPGGEKISPLPVMVLSCSAASWPKGTVRLDSEPW